MTQISFELPEFDRKRTQVAVEAALEKYRIVKNTIFEEREANTTASWSDSPKGDTGTTSDQTGDIATHNIDKKAERKVYCERIERAVKRLHPNERLLVEARYMKDAYVFDYVVYNHIFNPPISQGRYNKYRRNAFYQLAISLDIAVEKEKGGEEDGRRKK